MILVVRLSDSNSLPNADQRDSEKDSVYFNEAFQYDTVGVQCAGLRKYLPHTNTKNTNTNINTNNTNNHITTTTMTLKTTTKTTTTKTTTITTIIILPEHLLLNITEHLFILLKCKYTQKL